MVLKALGRIEEVVISLLFVTMILLVFVDVCIRFFANALHAMGIDPTMIWLQELTLNTSAWMVLFGASYGIKVGAHIGVDALTRLFDPPVRRLISLLAVGAGLVYCVLFFYASWNYVQYAYESWAVMEDIRLPVAIAKAIPQGLADLIHLDIEDLLSGIEAGAPIGELEAPGFPYWIFLSVLLVGMTLLFIRFALLGLALINGEALGFHMADEAEEALEHFGEDAAAGYRSAGRDAAP